MFGVEIAAFLDACPTATLVVDASGSVVLANAAAGELLQSDSPLSGTPVSNLLPEWPPASDMAQSSILCPDGSRKVCRIRHFSWPAASGAMTVVQIDAEDQTTPGELAARQANLRLHQIIEMLPQAVCVFDDGNRYVLWNQKYAELYSDIADYLRPGISFEEILKVSLAGDDMLEAVADKDAWFRERMQKFYQPVAQEEQKLRDGRWLRHDDRRLPDGGAIGMRIDITELKQREEWLSQLFDANPMPMLLCDGDSLAILHANQAAVDFYGFDRKSMLARHASDMHAEGDAERFASALRRLEGDCEARTVWRQRTAGGVDRHVLIYVRLLQEGSSHRLLLTVADVTERVLAEAEASRLAHHDILTGLPNRMSFHKALDEALRSDLPVVVYCLDLDGFKPVNDTFGHAAGDRVLVDVAGRLRAVAPDHMVARLGGDEFVILVTRTGGDAALASRCIQAFQAPFLIKGIAVSIGVSIGIATAETDGGEGDALMQAADDALYQAKAAGKNTWRFAAQDRPRRKRVTV